MFTGLQTIYYIADSLSLFTGLQTIYYIADSLSFFASCYLNIGEWNMTQGDHIYKNAGPHLIEWTLLCCWHVLAIGKDDIREVTWWEVEFTDDNVFGIIGI